MIKNDYLKIISFTGFGFASGLPYVLILITLTAWLRDVGIDLSLIGFISWISLAYSIKFLWAPFIDRFSIPFFNIFGSRRSWIVLMQIIIIISLYILSTINPITNLSFFAFIALIIALAGSIQDIAIDAYRIESAKLEDQGNLAAGYQFGYRIAILVGSSLALIIAANFSWSFAYQLMALIFIVMLFSNHIFVLYLYMAGLGLSNGFTENMSNSLWAEMYGVKNLGAIRALLTFFGVLASAASPFLYGLILDETNSINTLIYMSLALIIIFSSMSFIGNKIR